MASNYYYPVDVPPLELPASQTRFPTLQPAGAFLKQMQSPYGSNAQYAQQLQQLKSAHVGAAASPTSPSSVAVASSFLASIRMGLEDLVHDDDSDDDDEDDDDESPRYYSASSNNTYYSPPSSFSAQAGGGNSGASPLFPMAQASGLMLQQGAASWNTPKRDDDLIFDMEM